MVVAGVASPASPPARSLFVPNVIIGDASATVTFAGLVPGLAGVYQVNAVVPQGLAPGLQGLGWLMGDTGSITGIPIEQSEEEGRFPTTLFVPMLSAGQGFLTRALTRRLAFGSPLGPFCGY